MSASKSHVQLPTVGRSSQRMLMQAAMGHSDSSYPPPPDSTWLCKFHFDAPADYEYDFQQPDSKLWASCRPSMRLVIAPRDPTLLHLLHFRVPRMSIKWVIMSHNVINESYLDGWLSANLTDVNNFISWTRSECVIWFPVDIKCWCFMKIKLLFYFGICGIPYNCSFVNSGRKNIFSISIPF